MATLPCDLSSMTTHISDCCQLSDIHTSQGSVATYFRCGGIFKHEFVTNLPLSLPANEFRKSINISVTLSLGLGLKTKFFGLGLES